MTAQPDPPRQPPAARVAEPPAPESADKTAALAPASRGQAFPGAALTAPSFDDEIDTALSYEKGLAVKALLALALVALVILVRMLFLG